MAGDPETVATPSSKIREGCIIIGSLFNALMVQWQVKDPARFESHEITKVAHYYLSVNALK